jgi:hypothetical protein
MMAALQASHAPLREISFNYNFIGDEGARDIAKLMKDTPTLMTVDLVSNEVGDVGVRALLEAMAVHKSMATLGLEDNLITDGAAAAIGRAVATIAEKMALHTHGFGDADVNLILKNNNCGNEVAKAIAQNLRKIKRLSNLRMFSQFFVDLELNSVGEEGCFAMHQALAHSTLAYNVQNDAFMGKATGSSGGLLISLARCRVTPALKIELAVVRGCSYIKFSNEGKIEEMMSFFRQQRKHPGAIELLVQLISQVEQQPRVAPILPRVTAHPAAVTLRRIAGTRLHGAAGRRARAPPVLLHREPRCDARVDRVPHHLRPADAEEDCRSDGDAPDRLPSRPCDRRRPTNTALRHPSAREGALVQGELGRRAAGDRSASCRGGPWREDHLRRGHSVRRDGVCGARDLHGDD